jgi:anti-sigma factor RsiW
MRCRTAERWMSRFVDGELPPSRRDALDGHLVACPRCRSRARDFARLKESLVRPGVPEPLPYFYERLRIRIDEREKAAPSALWVRWSLRAIPVSLALIGFFIGAIAFVSPAMDSQLSQPEALLLRNDNPLTETKSLFEEEKVENKGMMIIFASNERIPTRRYGP